MSDFAIRPVVIEDARFLLDLRNSGESRRWSRTQHVVAWDDHLAWLRETLADEARVFRIVEVDGRPAGSLRFELDAEGQAEVSIHILATLRGRGVGRTALALAESELQRVRPDVHRLLAVVQEQNVASRRLFEAAGYGLERVEHGWCHYLRLSRGTSTS